ncbi:MAG: hypothetical protein EOS70_27955 [Mesorhizobium sp.]|uniref:hypothetical protein n=1 Tax=Mesorhizobium sp. TaxID=1871066 RepID=UPI000FEAAD23|nr:hypothetical protein [Mesorhizobium sp.]RWC28148.1 MAG: hypothetical protein EOS70_27955 [Mesorhizobium sp.]
MRATVKERLDAARAEVARLEREAALASCAEAGHTWESLGGAHCGCEDGHCSVPVLTCTRCGGCDYGENAEAAETRRQCQERAAP